MLIELNKKIQDLNDYFGKELEIMRRKQAEVQDTKSSLENMSSRFHQCEDKHQKLKALWVDGKLSDTLKPTRHPASWIQQLLSIQPQNCRNKGKIRR